MARKGLQKGFTYQVAPALIAENPGSTAKEIAEIALERDLVTSVAKDPVSSLANTLEKEVREDRHPSVVAVGWNPRRYYLLADLCRFQVNITLELNVRHTMTGEIRQVQRMGSREGEKPAEALLAAIDSGLAAIEAPPLPYPYMDMYADSDLSKLRDALRALRARL